MALDKQPIIATLLELTSALNSSKEIANSEIVKILEEQDKTMKRVTCWINICNEEEESRIKGIHQMVDLPFVEQCQVISSLRFDDDRPKVLEQLIIFLESSGCKLAPDHIATILQEIKEILD